MISKQGAVPGTDIRRPRVRFVGEDGNAYAIMGRVSQALKKAGVPKEVINAYYEEATSEDYSNLLSVSCRYVDAF